MARCPFAVWKSTGATPGGPITPRVLIYHVTAGLGDAAPHSGLEWHFEVFLDGRIQQQVDTGYRADANYHANNFAISVETEGRGDGVWTDAQLTSLVHLTNWCIATHPTIKRQRCNAWDGSGLGYHVMWGAPGPWTPVVKSCPGAKRIVQFNEILLPRLLTPTPPQPPTPQPPPFGPVTVYPYPEGPLLRHNFTMPLDDKGCGYRDIKVHPDLVFSILINAADPATNGYRSITASRLNVNGITRVVVVGGPPSGEVGLDVWSVGPR